MSGIAAYIFLLSTEDDSNTEAKNPNDVVATVVES